MSTEVVRETIVKLSGIKYNEQSICQNKGTYRVTVIRLLAVLSYFMLSSLSHAGDAEAGKAKSMVCSACHGQNGIAVIDGYPNLKGQNEQYLISSLMAYREKQRSGGLSAIMQAQALLLSEQDIENLAAYYSTLK